MKVSLNKPEPTQAGQYGLPPAQTGTNNLAVVSLVFGILNWLLLPFIGSIWPSSPAIWRAGKSSKPGRTAAAWRWPV